MQTIKHLLCPVDLSAPAEQALRYAAAISSVLDGDLTILHVRAAGGHQPEKRRWSDTSLDTFVSQAIGAKRSIRLLERHGDPVTEILRTAAAVGSDLIVMGTHGRTGFQRLLLGSVTERVIRRSPTPVVSVPLVKRTEGQGPVRLETVLCAIDFSEPSARAVGYGCAIAAAAGARLVFAHALEWSEELETLPGTGRRLLPSAEEDAIGRMNELLTNEMRLRCAPELVVGYGMPADEVLRLVHEWKADVVVVGIRRRTPIDLAIFGSTTQRLIRDGTSAVLTVGVLEST